MEWWKAGGRMKHSRFKAISYNYIAEMQKLKEGGFSLLFAARFPTILNEPIMVRTGLTLLLITARSLSSFGA